MSRSSDFLDSIEARGEERGEARGEERGVKMGIRQAVEGMLREGLSLSIIERVSAVSEDDIRKIASSIGVSVVG